MFSDKTSANPSMYQHLSIRIIISCPVSWQDKRRVREVKERLISTLAVQSVLLHPFQLEHVIQHRFEKQ